MRIAALLLFVVLLGNTKNLTAQTGFYDVSTIREVKIYFDETNWDHVLDSLYVDGLEERTLASVVIDGVNYDSVGVRYKGFSSVSTNRVKNPFNIKLDYIINGQNHDGIDKLKLGNVIQDPSFIREILSYEIARKYMPASKANYANVYINDTLWGLYANIEAVNKDFLATHYGTRTNSFFKCNPANLDLNGENSNLSDSPGTDTANYYPLYDLKSDFGWEELYQFIDTLNNTTASVEDVLNVDRTLWMHAFNYSLVNFDSYIGYAQNYYLYQDHHGRFNPILWDLNMSFASYRLADASDFWSGFTIAEAKTVDPLAHHLSVSVYPRPLMRNLFGDTRYRKMYIAHMRTIMEENFVNQDYSTRGQTLYSLIDASVAADTNKFYSYTDFQDNLTSTVSDLIDYPGITDLMDARATYLSTYPGYQGAPIIENINSTPQAVAVGDDIWITAKVTDATEVILAYRFGGTELFQKINMLDDGTQNDGVAGDSIYGAQISNIGNLVQYYIYADNDSAGMFSPERAAYEFHEIKTEINVGDLVINEFMASNQWIAFDDDGDYDDWIELHNTTNAALSTSGLYLSDQLNPNNRWAMPDAVIEPLGYLIVWADQDTAQSALHANFKLDILGDTIVLTKADSSILDSVSFGEQLWNISTGRYPNGTGPFMAMDPSFNWNNNFTSVDESVIAKNFKLYPNPAREEVNLLFEHVAPNQVEIRTVEGRLLQVDQVQSTNNTMRLNTSNLSSGLYYISLIYDNTSVTEKVIITQ